MTPPEPTEERGKWRDLALEAVDLLADWPELVEHRDALLAAEEHLPRFEVVESTYSMPHDEPIRHVSIHQRWHARIKSRNGEITWTTETLEHRQHAIAAAHSIADLIGAKVVDEAGESV